MERGPGGRSSAADRAHTLVDRHTASGDIRAPRRSTRWSRSCTASPRCNSTASKTSRVSASTPTCCWTSRHSLPARSPHISALTRARFTTCAMGRMRDTGPCMSGCGCPPAVSRSRFGPRSRVCGPTCTRVSAMRSGGVSATANRSKATSPSAACQQRRSGNSSQMSGSLARFEAGFEALQEPHPQQFAAIRGALATMQASLDSAVERGSG